MISVRVAPPEHSPWIAERAHCLTGPEFRAIEAVDDQGKILGMVGYGPWTPNGVNMHVALESPIALRRLLRPAFQIAFYQGRKWAFATVLGTNEKSLALVRGAGFVEAHRVADGWAPGVDLVEFEMRRDECRWIGAS